MKDNIEINLEKNTKKIETLRSVVSEVEEMAAKDGKKYFAVNVPSSEISIYLSKLKDYLGEKFEEVIKTKELRDGFGVYHITILEPPEISAYPQLLDFAQKELLHKKFSFNLGSIGSAVYKNKTTYFVLSKSPEIDFLRSKANDYLKEIRGEKSSASLFKKNLHITLGFINGDVYKNELKNDDSVIIPM